MAWTYKSDDVHPAPYISINHGADGEAIENVSWLTIGTINLGTSVSHQGWAHLDSNQGPTAYEAGALTTEL